MHIHDIIAQHDEILPLPGYLQGSIGCSLAGTIEEMGLQTFPNLDKQVNQAIPCSRHRRNVFGHYKAYNRFLLTCVLTSVVLYSLKMECEKLAQEKTEMQRHYVMVGGASFAFHIGSCMVNGTISRHCCYGPGTPERTVGQRKLSQHSVCTLELFSSVWRDL